MKVVRLRTRRNEVRKHVFFVLHSSVDQRAVRKTGLLDLDHRDRRGGYHTVSL